MASVVGAGGLGKTTVVKELYDRLKGDSTVCTVSAFVPVGQKPNLKKVFRDILIDLDKKEYMRSNYNILDESQLVDELLKYLKDKRYFIVIDDVWETQSWERIKLALDDNNNGSRLIATTRIANVADLAGVVYNLEPLPHHQSEKLFYTRIFGTNGTCPDNQLRELGDTILKKCHGVPLAIITMASLLVGKTRGEWIEVCKSVFCDERNRQGNQQVSDTEWILSLSYYDMPLHLKTCLLYLSAFPEDYFIRKNSLIRMWVAEGFVQRNERTGFFEVGEEYFNGLINRNMIQATPDWDNIVHGCRVHDMVLDLLRCISQQKNFLTISSNDGTILPSDKVLRVHRLAHQYRIVEPTHHDRHMDVLGNLRSLIACICDYEGVSLPRFKLLRVLALEGCKRREGFIHLEHLESLLHLRYLGIRGTQINDLPEGIGALKLLQTLDISKTRISELPSSIGQLTQLICLDAEVVKVPNGVIEKLTSLEELHIRVHNDTVGQFVRELRNLRELRLLSAMVNVTEPDVQIDFMESLGNLHKIQNLVLNGHIKDKIYQIPWNDLVLPQTLQCLIISCIEFPEVPSSCINPSCLPKLSILELHVEVLDEQGLKTLAGFPELSCLTVLTWRASKLTIHAADGCFQKLRTLSLPTMVRFVANEDGSVSFITGHDVAVRTETRKDARAVMPNLEMLHFRAHFNNLKPFYSSCANLGLECIPSLQKVKVQFTCDYAFSDDIEREQDALRKQIEKHPNRPILQMDIYGKDKIRSRPANHDLAITPVPVHKEMAHPVGIDIAIDHQEEDHNSEEDAFSSCKYALGEDDGGDAHLSSQDSQTSSGDPTAAQRVKEEARVRKRPAQLPSQMPVLQEPKKPRMVQSRANAHGNIGPTQLLGEGQFVEDIRTSQLLCEKCSSEIGGHYNLQDKKEREVNQNIISLMKIMMKEFKRLHERLDTYEGNRSTRPSHKSEQDNLRTTERTKADESGHKEDLTDATNEEIEMSAKKTTGTTDGVRPFAGRESEPSQDTEHKRRQNMKKVEVLPINMFDRPKHTISTSAEYVLCDKERETIQYIHNSAETKKLVDYGNYTIDKKEIRCLLEDKEFLNSETVNASIRLLKDNSAYEREDGCVYLETAYNTKILWRDANLKIDDPRIDDRNFIVKRASTYLKHDMVFFPINIPDSHWYAGVVNARKREIQVLDSLGYRLNEIDLDNVLAGLERHFDILIAQGSFEEGQKKWKDTKVTEWPRTRPIKHKMQYDSVSCGLFMLKFFEHWTGNRFSTVFTQEDITKLRLKQAVLLVNAPLNNERGSPGYQNINNRPNSEEQDV